jgi:NADH-quinone oxidoreductase subunit N
VIRFDTTQLAWHLPLICVVLGGVALLLLEAFSRGLGLSRRDWLAYLGIIAAGVAIFASIFVFKKLGPGGVRVLYDGMIVVDRFSVFTGVVFLISAILVCLLAGDFMRTHNAAYGELTPLILLGTAGMMILAQAGDLVTVFIGIETMSLAAYVLTGSFRRARRSQEAAMKYFVAGAFASGFLLYGIALVYGAVGDTNLYAIRAATAAHTQPIFLIGMVLLVVAFGFKVSAVPFHMWAPDAYEGAPTPVTAWMAAGVKAAAVAGLVRVFVVGFGGEFLPYGRIGWATIFAILAALTMTIGNLAALRQENVKRMLAYSSISHAGYILVGVVAAGVVQDAGGSAQPALLYYLAAYTFTTVGAFGVVAWIGSRGDERQLVDDWAGLGLRNPLGALAMTIFLLSLGGIPPTAGFFGKFYVFRAAMDAPGNQLLWLVVVGVLNSVVSIYYYLRVVMAMYFREPAREPTPIRSGAMTAALVIAALFVLEMGILPGHWLAWTRDAVLTAVHSAR